MVVVNFGILLLNFLIFLVFLKKLRQESFLNRILLLFFKDWVRFLTLFQFEDHIKLRILLNHEFLDQFEIAHQNRPYRQHEFVLLRILIPHEQIEGLLSFQISTQDD